MKKLVALTVACMAVVALGACGSSSKKASTSKNSSKTTVVGADVAADLLKYCDTSKAAQDVSGAATTAGSDLKSSLTNLKGNLDAYVAAAPSEIKADVRIQVDKGLKPFIAALEKANYDITKADLSALAALGSDAELTAANGRITAYYTAHCSK